MPELLASVDGVVCDAAAATVPVTDDGVLRGDGVFEVVRVYAGRPHAWAEHLERMAGSARALRLDADLERLDREARALLEHAPGFDGQVRMLATRGGRRVALLEEVRAHAASVALATVTFAPTRILDGVKSLSYAANMLATRVAREAGADEALLVTPHGRVLEGPTSAFFYVLGGTLHTPPLSDHILDSITRRQVLEVTGAAERVTTTDDLRVLQEAFLASTTREVQAVASVDGRALPNVPGEATTRAAAALRARIEGGLA